jgi:hypothetical protein
VRTGVQLFELATKVLVINPHYSNNNHSYKIEFKEPPKVRN